jgi:hypothetical protein
MHWISLKPAFYQKEIPASRDQAAIRQRVATGVARRAGRRGKE